MATAAARIRRNTEQAEIILFEKGAHISYANCGLPYYIGGVIEDRERLFVQTPEAFGKRFAIDVRTKSEVTGIDVKKKTVQVRTSDGRVYTESYDKLLLSPGASPVRPPLPGIDSEGIFTLRNVADTDRIKQYMQEHPVKRAVIVGGGPYCSFQVWYPVGSRFGLAKHWCSCPNQIGSRSRIETGFGDYQFPGVGLLFSLMPESVLGGATLLMFGTVATAGIRIIALQEINRKATLVIAISLCFGLGVEMIPEILSVFPENIQNFFSSRITTGGVMAILSNLLILIKED